MTSVPLGINAYNRTYGQEPEIQLVNRFFEENPTNQIEKSALLSRPGTTFFLKVGGGPIRRFEHQPGAFDDDLFIVSGPTLFRYDGETILEIGGIIQGDGVPGMTIVSGPGYEHLFVADGVTLQYYDGEAAAKGILTLDSGNILDGDTVEMGTVYYEWTGGDVDAGSPDGSLSDPFLVNLDETFATGTLTVSGGQIETTDVVKVGTVYYEFTDGDVNDGTPAGTVGFPWLVKMGTTDATALANLILALNASGAAGINYSTGLVGNTSATGSVSTDKTATVTAVASGTAGNAVSTTETGASLAWGALTLEGGGPDNAAAFASMFNAVNDTGTPGLDYSTVLSANLNIEATASTDISLSVSARDRGAAGNLLTTTFSGAGDLLWASGTLQGGGAQILNGVITPDDIGMRSLTNLASFVLASQSDSQRFYWIQPGAVIIDALDFAEAESEPDHIVDMLRIGDTVYIFGQSSTEVWYATGTTDIDASPFLRQQGLAFSQGAIPGTAVPIRTQAVVVAEDEKVYQVVGGPKRLSQNGIEERIRIALKAEAEGA